MAAAPKGENSAAVEEEEEEEAVLVEDDPVEQFLDDVVVVDADDDLRNVADEILGDDEVDEMDELQIGKNLEKKRLSDDSWLTVESELDAGAENVPFTVVEEEDEEEKKPKVITADVQEMAKASKVSGKSVLDCVVELLRGTRAQKKKSMFRAPTEKWIWLGEDLSSLMWKSKKRPDVTGKINLIRCRSLRSDGNTLTFQLERKKLVLTLSSKQEVALWVTGLSCLVPREAKVIFNNERLNYDPLKDSSRGKPISTRKRVNEYLLLGGIGKGSFGKVKLAMSTLDKRFYAVKIMNKPRKANFESETNKEETAILRKLNHPNICKHRDLLYERETERVVLVVEYMARGVVLDSSKLEGVKPLAEDAVREIMKDVVSGLLYLHSQRVVHRDIKPDNLLRAGDGTVKLGDFGEARMYDVKDPDMKSKPQSPGTPAFLAPEFCMSDKSPKPPAENYAADVWSLGATIYYMVFGKAPFIASSVFELYDVICTENLRFGPVPPISRALKDLLKMTLTKEPQSRATLQQVANHTWFEEPIKMKATERIKVTKADIEDAIQEAKWRYPKEDAVEP